MPGVHVLLYLLASLPGLSAAHPDSLSRSRLVVVGNTARLELRFQSLSLLEVAPELDLDQNGELSQAECAAGQSWVLGYVAEHWRLLEGAGGEDGQYFELAEPTLLHLSLAAAGEGALPPNGPRAAQVGLGWIEAHFEFEAPKPLGGFRIESSLFVEQNPAHRDMASVVFQGEDEFFLPFQAGPFRYDFEPESGRRPGVLLTYFELGYEHIKGGYDHLAFLLVLIVAVPRPRSLLGLVTAFTVAHSISLAATVLNLGGLFNSMDSALVEMGIALSIAYVACDNLLRRGARNAWPEAFLFGLLHGLGFAGFLRDALGGEPMIATALVGFNLGVEAGQLLVVLLALALLLLCRRLGGSDLKPAYTSPAESGAGDALQRASFAPPIIRNLVSLGVALLGFFWFFQRTGWFA